MRGRRQSNTMPLRRALDQQIAREEATIQEIEDELVEHKATLRNLRQMLRAMNSQGKRGPRKQRANGERTAAQRAGSGNVNAARKVLKQARRLAKPEIARRMASVRGVEAINDGTVTYAITALVEAGEARQTDVREGGAHVFEYVTQSRSTVSRPGDR